MLAAIDARTKVLFLCSPNNPTGSYWNEAKLRRFLDRIDGRQIVVLDEAYCEFVEADDFPDGMKRPVFYSPVERGFERELKKRVDWFAKLREKRGS